MTQLEIAEAVQECLAEIANIAEMTVAPVTENNCEDTLVDAKAAADDIAVYLGELRGLLKEADE